MVIEETAVPVVVLVSVSRTTAVFSLLYTVSGARPAINVSALLKGRG